MTGAYYMDATIAPHRSLSRKGFIAMITAVTAINVVTAVVFVILGAAPIPIFIGLDLAAVLLAFHYSYKSARRLERVKVSADYIEVQVEEGEMRETVWSSPTAFTQVALVEDDDEPGVRLRLSGKSLSVAAALSPGERKDFCTALEAAIRRARSERHFA